MSLSLLCLHLNQCFHGDIKPANILVDLDSKNQNVYYLTDYGEGKIVEELKKTDNKTLSFLSNLLIISLALRGTPFYFAPDLWNYYSN